MFWEILGGLVGGLIGGMGMGGGTLLIPILTLLGSFKQLEAQGINLISFIPMSIVALILHFKNKLVRVKQTYLLALVGALVSLVSALIAVHINAMILRKIFAVFLLAIGIWQLIELIIAFKQSKQN